MASSVSLNTVRRTVSKIYFHNDGDSQERQWWPFLKERFPNCEEFWRQLIVPLTHRVIPEENDRIRNRQGVADDIQRVSHLHYTVFMHLAYAYDHLLNDTLSSFEDFYTHLVSACDLAEDFLIAVHLLVLESRGQKSSVLQGLTREEFMDIARNWYDKNYAQIYQNYLSKGKTLPINLPSRPDLLAEYVKNAVSRKKYQAFVQKLRQYRNRIVHGIPLGLISVGKALLVLKKEKILNYRTLADVLAASQDITKLSKDFINRREQMVLDISELERHLNVLWRQPLQDLKNLLYKERNPILLRKYNITAD